VILLFKIHHKINKFIRMFPLKIMDLIAYAFIDF